MIDSAAFDSLFGGAPSLRVVAPGRVDLLGSHTDYNGLPVCACAISRGVTFLLRPREDAQVQLVNGDPRFERGSFELSRDIPHSPQGSWVNYVKAGAQGVAQQLDGGRAWRGFDALVAGDLPAGAGLSSSSALVVAAALATLAANCLELPPAELADMLARAEHYVGTQGGGMDQATILLSEADSALKIDFFPLRFRRVSMPADWRLAICHSLVRAEKTKDAMDHYNRRVIECRLGLQIIRNSMKQDPRAAAAHRLGDLAARGLSDLDQFLGMTDFILTQDSYSCEQAARALALEPAAMAETYCRRRDGSLFPEPPGGFRLRQRVQHVLGEALRVEQGAEALERGDAAALGREMDGSYESARDLYEISNARIDGLIAAMRAAGAKGARLAGAGFGGCCVGLVMAADAEAFQAAMRRSYYADDALRDWAQQTGAAARFEELCFVVKAAPGARVETIGQARPAAAKRPCARSRCA